MNAFIEIKEPDDTRFTFYETLSGEFVTMTGHGAYVYLNPVEIDQLFNGYLNHSLPVSTFARQCARNVLRFGLERALAG